MDYVPPFAMRLRRMGHPANADLSASEGRRRPGAEASRVEWLFRGLKPHANPKCRMRKVNADLNARVGRRTRGFKAPLGWVALFVGL